VQIGHARITPELSAFFAGFVAGIREPHAKKYISALIAF
jgi:hypothetical protein